MTGSITLAGETIFGPTTVPIADLLMQIQNQQDDPMICYGLQDSLYGSCSLCATVDGLQINGDSIHYCGTGLLNCSNAITSTLSQTFDIPCFDLENCGLFNCRNDCYGRGTCSSLGICQCDPGYYGYDCSVQLSENCVYGPLFDSTCWTVNHCDQTLDVTITNSQSSSVKQITQNEFTQFDIVPCSTVIDEANLKCDMCVTMEQIQPQGTGYNGCPSISMSCNTILARKDSLDCIYIPTTTKCPEPMDPSPNSTSSPIYIYVLGFFSVLLILALVYLVIQRLGLLSKPQQQDLYVVEDEEPLNTDY